ncbi:MAG: sigma-70 family RNA polymerase sigma factor [Candidatus Moduliflexus flocculans]|nr:sigma-70 family RNA polymerase sigma factor [Candidatus Moduliflexus flocculans]
MIFEIPDKKQTPEVNAVLSERHKLILNAINKLNPKLKEVVILYDIEDLTYEQISEKIKCPIGTVKSRLFNARKILKSELKELLI